MNFGYYNRPTIKFKVHQSIAKKQATLSY